MKKNKNILAIIPARGKSKRLPGKNTKLLSGKPLIAYTIEAAKNSKYIHEIVVSTDSHEITEISKKYGVTIVKRPAELAKDNSRTVDAVFHVLSKLEGTHKPDVIILLQPTSPLRDENDIDAALEIFFKKKPQSLISVSELDHSLNWSFKVAKDFLKPLLMWKNFKKQSQTLDKVYKPNGAIAITSLSSFIKNKDFYNKKMIPYVMPKEKSIDIDDESDFTLIDEHLKNGRSL